MSKDERYDIVIVGAGDHARVLVDVIKGNSFSEFEEWDIIPGLCNPHVHASWDH